MGTFCDPDSLYEGSTGLPESPQRGLGRSLQPPMEERELLLQLAGTSEVLIGNDDKSGRAWMGNWAS